LPIIVVAEGSETPGSGQGRGGEPEGLGSGGFSRRNEGDLLAERRARRAAESGKDALIRRAEVAEATMETLQVHVGSLQERLREAEQEQRRLTGLLEAEVESAAETLSPPPAPQLSDERELQRAKQREYAEEQLRIDAEERLSDLETASREEIERLKGLLQAGERNALDAAEQLDGARRQLAEAEQAAAAERSGVRRAEQELGARLLELERRTVDVNRGLDAERRARERTERLLESMSRGHRLMQGLVGELRELVVGLTAALASEPARHEQAGSASLSAAPEPRVFAHVEEAPPPTPPPTGAADLAPEPASQPPREARPGGVPSAEEQRAGEEMAEALAAAVVRLRERAQESVPRPPAARPPHKHSMSLITRWRLAIRRRRKRSRAGSA
jgi:hypothetical protein